MSERPWHGAVIIFDDGQCYVQKNRADPESSVLVELEGKSPNDIQIKRCREI
jgi:hypothetical protein